VVLRQQSRVLVLTANLGEKAVAEKNVKELYTQYVKDGMTKKDAAKLAQAQTGHSAVTGGFIKPPNPKLVTHGFIGSKKYGFGMY